LQRRGLAAEGLREEAIGAIIDPAAAVRESARGEVW
jgi:hypothetical protein